MKRGLLRGLATFMILAELTEGPKRGYEIDRALSSKLDAGLPPGYIYVMLERLERKGLVRAEGGSGRRRHKAYSITTEGLNFLLEHEEHIKRLMRLLQDISIALETIRERLPISQSTGDLHAEGHKA